MAVLAALRSNTSTVTPEEKTPAASGVFLSPTSLTFPVAASVSSILLGVADRIHPGAAQSVLFALVAALVIGGFIIWQGAPTSGDTREKGAYYAVGLLNIVLLTAAVMGVATFATGEAVAP